MKEKRILRYWLEKWGYEWIGENHPEKPLERPYTRKFTEAEARFDIELFEKHGYIRKLNITNQ